MLQTVLACVTFAAVLGAWVLVARVLRAEGWRALDEAARREGEDRD